MSLYGPNFSYSNKRTAFRDSTQDRAEDLHHGHLDRAAKLKDRKPVCIIHCPAVGGPMRAAACRERQKFADQIQAIAEGCKGCKRLQQEAKP